MYSLREFHAFLVTEGNKILHLHCSWQLQAENSSNIHEKYELSAFPHPESHEFLKPLIYSRLETSESPRSMQKDTNFQHFKCTHWPMSMAMNKGSTFLNLTLRTHFQDHYLVHPSSFKTIPQMHSMTPCQHHHKPTLITFLGTPSNTIVKLFQAGCDRF